MAMASPSRRGFLRHVGRHGTIGLSSLPGLGLVDNVLRVSNPRLVRLFLHNGGSPPPSSIPRERDSVLPPLLRRGRRVGCLLVAWCLARLQPREAEHESPRLRTRVAPDVDVGPSCVPLVVSDELNAVVPCGVPQSTTTDRYRVPG